MLALATLGCHFQGWEGGKGAVVVEILLEGGGFLQRGPDARGVPAYMG